MNQIDSKDFMSNGMGPWIFASIVFIGMVILFYRLLNIIGKHLHENSAELKSVNNSLLNIGGLLNQGMMLISRQNMEARMEPKNPQK